MSVVSPQRANAEDRTGPRPLAASGSRWRSGGLVLVALWIVAISFPLYWTVTMALKPPDEWVGTHWFPSHLDWTNLTDTLLPATQESSFSVVATPVESALEPLLDSLIVTVGGMMVAVVLGYAVAYAMSRYEFGGQVLPLNILSVRMFPPIAAVIPLIVMFTTIGSVDSHWTMILVYGGLTAPFAVWLTKSFIDDVPRELEEAALLDGHTPLGAMVRVTLPLTLGSIVTTALFVFIVIWSDFLIAFTLGGQNVETVPVRLASLNSSTQGQLYGPQAALGLVAAVPVVIFGLAIQRYLARGLTFGAVKQ